MLDQALQLAREHRGQAESDLFELISIPSVSSLSRHHEDCRRAAAWVAEHLHRMGMEVEMSDVSADGLPVISAQWLGRPGAPTLALYGHYDVQPADPLDQWRHPPFEPTVDDGFVYARGSNDNKGQLMASVKAAEYAFAAGGPPVNLRFLIEGEEEINGTSLPTFVKQNADRLPTDYLFIADGIFTAPGLPNLLTGLRGLLYVEIEVEGPSADLHSGLYGGVAPNPLNSLAHILSRLKGPDGRITIPGFYDDVRPPAAAELDAWERLTVTDADLLATIGSRALEGEVGFDNRQRRWTRPTLDVHGIVGGFVDEGQKTVIPARAKAKVSMRLVPGQTPEGVLARLEPYVAELATPGVEVRVRSFGGAKPVLCGTDHPGVAAASRAYEAAYGAPPVLVREGATVPVTIDFQETLHPHLLVTGFGLPGDGLHSPNERFSLDQYHRGTEMVLHLMRELVSS